MKRANLWAVVCLLVFGVQSALASYSTRFENDELVFLSDGPEDPAPPTDEEIERFLSLISSYEIRIQLPFYKSATIDQVRELALKNERVTERDVGKFLATQTRFLRRCSAGLVLGGAFLLWTNVFGTISTWDGTPWWIAPAAGVTLYFSNEFLSPYILSLSAKIKQKSFEICEGSNWDRPSEANSSRFSRLWNRLNRFYNWNDQVGRGAHLWAQNSIVTGMTQLNTSILHVRPELRHEMISSMLATQLILLRRNFQELQPDDGDLKRIVQEQYRWVYRQYVQGTFLTDLEAKIKAIEGRDYDEVFYREILNTWFSVPEQGLLPQP